MKLHAFLTLSFFAVVACNKEQPAQDQAQPQAQALPKVAEHDEANKDAANELAEKTVLADGSELYGEALPADNNVVALSAILAEPEKYAGKAVTLAATVRQACTSKGCWMELAESDAKEKQGCRVTFKDYGFFVPLNSAGATAKVHGVVEVSDVSAREVQHLQAEGGSFSHIKPDGSAHEVRIVASGVELTGRKQEG